MMKKQYSNMNVSDGTVKKSKAVIAATTDSAKILGQTPFGDVEAKFLKFTVNLRCAPVGVLLDQPSDRHPNLSGDARSATALSGTPPPVEPKPGAVPADNSIGLHYDQDLGQAGPEAAEDGPEKPVRRVQCWSRPITLEHGDLLSESENLKGRIASAAEEYTDDGKG